MVITRLNRAGIELVASNSASLQFGDILNLVGRPEAIEAVSAIVGNAQQKLQQVQMLPVFIGVGLGFYWGRYRCLFRVSGGITFRASGWSASGGVDPRTDW